MSTTETVPARTRWALARLGQVGYVFFVVSLFLLVGILYAIKATNQEVQRFWPISARVRRETGVLWNNSRIFWRRGDEPGPLLIPFNLSSMSADGFVTAIHNEPDRVLVSNFSMTRVCRGILATTSTKDQYDIVVLPLNDSAPAPTAAEIAFVREWTAEFFDDPDPLIQRFANAIRLSPQTIVQVAWKGVALDLGFLIAAAGLLLSAPATYTAFRHRFSPSRRRLARHRCGHCNYDLSATPRAADGKTRCPECGREWLL